MKIIRADLYRFFHSNKLIVTLILYILALYFCNFSDMIQFNEFLSVDTMIDSITESGWFREILYVISALPFTLCYCEDISNNYFLCINTRTNITSYARSKALVTILSTFFVSIAGLLMVIVLFSFNYPLYDPKSALQLNISGGYGTLTTGAFPFLFFFVRILLFASGSVLWAIIALFVSSYQPDYFLTTVMPFVSSYVIYRFVMNLPDILNIDYCISGYCVIDHAGIMYNFLYSMGYIWLAILIISTAFIQKLERSI
ncbi:hypothetical protein C8E03_10884 [Lachnotalea glycerini]|uniref:ABC-2 family transporter n=1 Tax=Lachnotalea glycerini TaxID=1763509 RepID=A0A255I8J9_9FIRM|nr:hypothetical protein [Lachnotalea glycerini]PXV88361.1 hypothetical protein C8E03_10884 [Lachnotalea glycerini]RDY29101.1 hypothetical protein CG710_018685 [Lachnotalea glycerini]